MYSFEWAIGLLLGAMALAALARRLRVPYPTFLALGGAALALLPNSPEWTLEPDLALALLVAPVLLDAAFDTSLRDLRDNWLPVATLVVVAVGITTMAAAAVAKYFVPEMPWAAAIALGAIVAPPDAGAATAVLRSVKLPYRILKILEGESLLNDASALLIYRVAVGAATASTLSPTEIVPALAWAIIGSLVLGYALARVSMILSARTTDVPSSIIIQFAGTFTVWLIADRLALSSILTIVVYAVTLARNVPAYTPARLRVPAYAVWETAVFVLNVVAFVLIGLQLRPIWNGMEDGVRSQYVIVAGAVLVAIIVTRVAWVMSYNTAMRLATAKERHVVSHRPSRSRPTAKGGLLVAWCGMRGIVTLAAAFALPSNFPYRDLILLTAFAAVVGTLVIQGLTLRPLVSWFAMDDGDPVAHEVSQARSKAYRAALDAIHGDHSAEGKLLRKEYQQMLDRAEHANAGLESGELPADPLRRKAISAARDTMLEMRRTGEIGDDAFHRLEEELDWAELSATG